ncbi:MAG: VWA domain-containing protein [Chloroflexota bacterium]|nr:VWA domain-containing protein [Chloroflexota bacterium]
MSSFTNRFRYSRWDNTQQLEDLSAEDLLDALSDELIADGDLYGALRRMYRWGDEGRLDGQIPGLQQLLERLRQQRQAELAQHDLGGIFDEIRERLQDVVDTERQGIQDRLDRELGGQTPQQGSPQEPGESGQQGDPPQGRKPSQQGMQSPQGAQSGQQGAQRPPIDPALRKLLEQVAAKKQQFLQDLPADPAGQLRELSEYEFMNPDAAAKFAELQEMLKQQVMQQQFQGLKDAISGMTPQDLEPVREMVRDLNQMLNQRMQGIEPDFQKFKEKHGRFFPPDINSLDELIEHLQKQRAQMQSLLNSLSPEQRQQLQQMMDNLLGDDQLRSELGQMAAMLDQLAPGDQFGNSYNFSGSQPLGLQEAMQLMERMQGLDELEGQMEGAQYGRGLDQIDPKKVSGLLGPEAAQQLEQLQNLTKVLEEAGLIQRRGDHWELTPRAIRRIGQRALQDIFGKLSRDRFGGHKVDRYGVGGDRMDESKPYAFGDPFLLDMKQTMMNAVGRSGAGTPLRLVPDDFEVYRTELSTQSSTVLMIDMSRSMMLRGLFFSAKKVAMALDSLIRGQFPRDNLYIVGFAYLAREMKPADLPAITSSEYEYGTNLEHGLMLARKLLNRHSGNKQVIVVTDGEPTAHVDAGTNRVIFNYPPLRETYTATLAEVRRCTKDQIVINTFMLDRSPYLSAFVEQMSKLNKGRAFYATPERLGQYVLVDYVSNKRKNLR